MSYSTKIMATVICVTAISMSVYAQCNGRALLGESGIDSCIYPENDCTYIVYSGSRELCYSAGSESSHCVVTQWGSVTKTSYIYGNCNSSGICSNGRVSGPPESVDTALQVNEKCPGYQLKGFKFSSNQNEMFQGEARLR